MKRACGFFLALLLVPGAFAQITRSFGSVVFPGGTSATTPGITRNFGSVVFPGGSPTSPPVRSGPAFATPPAFNFNRGNSFYRGNSFNGGNSFRGNGRGNRGAPAAIFGYPLYMPGYFDTTAPSSSDAIAPMAPPEPQQPNVTVVYPQQQPQDVRPIIIQIAPDGTAKRLESQSAPAPQVYQPAEPPAAAPDADQEPHYLIAFKDHTIYSAVAYWFDGDTLHYFTRGDTHNQVSVSLIDRELTERLNRELGIEFKMPAAK
jgi:hypothetical protein